MLRIALVIPVLLPLAAAADDTSLFADVAGTWEGELAYVDYGSGDRVALPARLEAEVSDDDGFLITRLEFTDPGRVVRTFEVSTFDPPTGDLITTSFADRSVVTERWSVTERDVAPGQWTLVMSTRGQDDGRPADLRVTRRLESGQLTSTTEVRPDGETAWRMRNELRVRRAAPDPAELVGTWKVDLRPTPDAEPHYQEMVVRAAGETVDGTFYGSAMEEGCLNADWGTLALAFRTGDGSGAYHTSARLVDGRLEGTTHSIGRGFLSVWTAVKQP